jgi:large subunit ribosomal protein L21
MYAVIKAGGKQHRVKPGDVIEVELIHGGQDEAVSFTPILVVDDDGKAHVGKELGKALVTAKLLGEQKGDKIKIFKYRPKSGYARRQGHRQMYTMVEIQDVKLGGRAGAGAKKADQSNEKAEEVGDEAPPTAQPVEADSAPEAPAEQAAEAAAAAEPEAATPSPGQPEEAKPKAEAKPDEPAPEHA